MGIRKRLNIILCAICLLILFLSAWTRPVFAAEKEKATITVTMPKIQADASVQLRLRQVAEKGDDGYELLAAYRDRGINLSELSSAAEVQQAADLLASQKEEGLPEQTCTKENPAVFTVAQEGMYLLDAKNGEVTPTLIQVENLSDEIEITAKYKEAPEEGQGPKGSHQTSSSYMPGALLFIGIVLLFVGCAGVIRREQT